MCASLVCGGGAMKKGQRGSSILDGFLKRKTQATVQGRKEEEVSVAGRAGAHGKGDVTENSLLSCISALRKLSTSESLPDNIWMEIFSRIFNSNP